LGRENDVALAPWKGWTSGPRGLALAAALSLFASVTLAAQSPLRPAITPPPAVGTGPWKVQAGPEYEAGWLRTLMMGTGYRNLWTTPVTVPVLDPSREGGGLYKVLRVGGGLQTQTIHFRGRDDGYYLFRSVNKAVRTGLDPDVRDTPGGWLVQEVTASMHPAGGWVMPRLLDAVGVAQSFPKLYLMPDDPVLGEHRERFAGVLGMLVESPDKGESGSKRYQHSDDIAGTEDMLERLESRPGERVHARKVLASRLIDVLAGDPDRNFDNFRWIAYDSAGRIVWHPVPMDMDPAFLRGGGMIGWLVREAFIPKYVKFGPEYDDAAGLWDSQPEVDRLLLAELDWPTWDSTIAAVRAALSDEVIDEAVRAMPAEYVQAGGDFLASSLKARRDALRDVAWRFYSDMSEQVDVQATSAADVAEVTFADDGSVSVALHSDCQPPRVATQQNGGGAIECTNRYFERLLDPEQTEEVRVYLRAGDDRAVVHGGGPQRIRVRVIGGAGNDMLEDGSTPQGSSRVVFYDDEGENQLTRGNGTRVEVSEWNGREITDFITNESKDSTYRDFGNKPGWAVLAEHEQSAGLILGVRRRATEYGFRADPWAQQTDVSARASVSGGFGGDLVLRRRLEGSRVVIAGRGGYSQRLWSYRFYGFGNDAPLGERSLAIVPADEARASLELELPLGSSGTFAVGPAFRYLWTEPHPDGPLGVAAALGFTDFGQAGVAARLRLRRVNDEAFPRLGFELRGDGGGWAALQADGDPFGSAEGEARAYVPFLLGSAVALRVGGGSAWGDVPVHESIFLGGRRTLRGFQTQRFAGDASLYGSSELRLPLGHLTLLTRGRVGVLGFADAGRVYVDGESPGDWHTSYGGGLWYSTMGITGSLVYGVGEQNRLHAYFGLPF
jgi:hypothetical protein